MFADGRFRTQADTEANAPASPDVGLPAGSHPWPRASSRQVFHRIRITPPAIRDISGRELTEGASCATVTGKEFQTFATNPTRILLHYYLSVAACSWVVLGITSIIFIPTIVIRAGGGTDAYLSWAVFGAVAVSGVCTALQAVRLGRVGAGYLLFMGPAGAFIGVCVSALNEGGPALLATLVVASSLIPIVISMRLALFRRLLTPTIVGTVNMLVPATVLPVVFGRLADTPHDTALAPLLTALATILVISGISLTAGASLRLWAPAIGVVAGSVVGGSLGLYDLERVARAPWIGLPLGDWPGIGIDVGPAFLELLPAFVFVSLIGAIQTITGTIAVQRVSWRRPRAVD